MLLSNDLVKITSVDLSPNEITPTLDLITNSFTVEGFQPIQTDPTHTFTLDLFQLQNKGYVSASQSISIELFHT